MLYKRYRDARDAAWRTLINYHIQALPVDVEGIAKALSITVEGWPNRENTPKLHALLPPSARCASLRIQGQWHIFMHKGLSYSQYRFALAHELGHIILRHPLIHPAPGIFAFTGTQNDGDILDEPVEEWDQDADMFAIRLLAPACVLHGLHILEKRQLGDLCGLPEKAAAMRADRMRLLDSRNAYYTHPLEQQLRAQFAPFIREKAVSQVPQANQAPVPPLVLPKPSPGKEKNQRRFSAFMYILFLVLPGGLILYFIIQRLFS